MNASARLAAVTLALVLPALVLARWTLATTTLHGGEVELSLREEIGVWRSVEGAELEEKVLAMIDPDDYLMRLYQAPDRTPIWVFVSLYTGGKAEGGAHDPQRCYPAQGWEIMDSSEVTVPVGESASLEARELQTHKGALEEQVLYWFQPADRRPGNNASEQFTRILDGVRGRPQYAFVRLSASGTKEVGADLRELASEIATLVREDVDRL